MSWDTNQILTTTESIQLENSTGSIINPATEEKQDQLIALQEMSVLLRGIFSLLQFPRNADPNGNADRVTVQNTINANVTTAVISSLNNGHQAHQMSVATEINAWYLAQRPHIQ